MQMLSGPSAQISGSNRGPWLTIIGGNWLDNVLILLAVLTWFAVPMRTLALLTDWAKGTSIVISVIATAAFAFFSLSLVRYVPGWLTILRGGLQRLPVWPIVTLGLLLRLAWILAFPATPGSDGATYLSLARQLASGGEFETSGTFAYWPPGYPLVLSAWMSVFGTSKASWLFANMLLYIAAIVGVVKLTEALGGPLASRLAAILFALWPNLIAHVATPEKEMLVVPALLWACYFLVRAINGYRPIWHLFSAGILMGINVLVQPSLQFLIPVLVVLSLVTMRMSLRGVIASLCLILGAAVVVLPWTIRNQQIFQEFVLVSTNGGSNLYRANNPLATGGYTKRGEVDLSDLSEVDQDKAYKQLGLDWIKGNPAQFAVLAFEKQIRFMGDDSGGVYNTLKVGKGSERPVTFIFLKGLANAWWLASWCVLVAFIRLRKHNGVPMPALARLPVWLWLYLFAIHTVFESAGKYHVPVLWVLPVLIGLFAFAQTEEQPK